MEFNYYYGTEAEQFSFIRIPKVMLTEERFAPLSLAAKILYGVLLDRMALSVKNGWLDKEQRVYIIFKIEEIQELLGFSKKKIKYFTFLKLLHLLLSSFVIGLVLSIILLFIFSLFKSITVFFGYNIFLVFILYLIIMIIFVIYERIKI